MVREIYTGYNLKASFKFKEWRIKINGIQILTP
jgi:hypothetical protein